ncbi:cell division protein FtsQ [Orrella marina]|uniref:Cell division protein FtsQ n=1 Tax=Orrella marina TaxID=2163011 RepID=A0A2R4XM01_9BURK|nr:cell division protein FtsQ [Orrella marina]AWB34827.1 cell division protein FtsQ [Orrella marina]
MKSAFAATLTGVLSLSTGSGLQATEIKLYPTGPAQDSAFVRFVNGSTDDTLSVQAADSNASLELTTSSRASPYMPVTGGTSIGGTLRLGTDTESVQVKILPGEFVTVLGFDSDQKLQIREVREEGDGFTAVRASVAFYDLNEDCKQPGVQVAGRQVFLFENGEVGKWARRQINPVPLQVQLTCSGTPTGEPLNMGTLQAGERYSLFLVPGDPARSLFFIKDSVAN